MNPRTLGFAKAVLGLFLLIIGLSTLYALVMGIAAPWLLGFDPNRTANP